MFPHGLCNCLRVSVCHSLENEFVIVQTFSCDLGGDPCPAGCFQVQIVDGAIHERQNLVVGGVGQGHVKVHAGSDVRLEIGNGLPGVLQGVAQRLDVLISGPFGGQLRQQHLQELARFHHLRDDANLGNARPVNHQGQDAGLAHEGALALNHLNGPQELQGPHGFTNR